MNANFDQARNYVFGRLERELPGNLFYHGIHHTRDDVLPAAEKFGNLERVNGEDFLVLKTAALYHDLGYVENYTKNEPIAVRIASETLPGFGYSKSQIYRVGEIIMATQVYFIDGKIIQKPNESDLLQKIMCDADLDNLGREDFYVICDLLRRELAEHGIKKSLRTWYEDEIKFLENHSYFTSVAKSLRDEGKARHLDEIRNLLYGEIKSAA